MSKDSETLEKIYEDNKSIEWSHELKGNPPIAGSIAKKLLRNCKLALKIISKYQAVCEDDLKECIKEMEDELAKDGRIRTITYNLGARNYIHVSLTWIHRWNLKK